MSSFLLSHTVKVLSYHHGPLAVGLMEGYSIKELAAILGLRQAQVRSQAAWIRKKYKERLGGYVDSQFLKEGFDFTALKGITKSDPLPRYDHEPFIGITLGKPLGELADLIRCYNKKSSRKVEIEISGETLARVIQDPMFGFGENYYHIEDPFYVRYGEADEDLFKLFAKTALYHLNCCRQSDIKEFIEKCERID